MTSLNSAQLRYLREVLGVEEILWRAPVGLKAPNQRLSPFRVSVFVDSLSIEDRTLLGKMLLAMKLPESDYKIFEAPEIEEYETVLLSAPVLCLVFGQALSARLNINFESRGKFIDQKGVATIVTHGPSELTQNPELKAEAWKDMKLAMGRLS